MVLNLIMCFSPLSVWQMLLVLLTHLPPSLALVAVWTPLLDVP